MNEFIDIYGYKIEVTKCMEGIYEEISTMIRNGLYPIDK